MGGESAVVTTAGWMCFAALIIVDVVFIVGFLEYNGAIDIWDNPDFGKNSTEYGDKQMNTPQWIYFGIMCVCNTVVFLIIFSLGGAFAKRLLNKRKLAAAMNPDGERRLSHVTGVTVLLPCYLPNEQVILRDTVQHIIEKIEYPTPFELILCYNTPKALAIEEELAALDGKVYDNQRTLRVLKVEGSRSKAENLNAALDLVETENVVIDDADHHADPDSLMIATEYMKLHNCHCVQGSTYIRYKPTLLARIIDAEFFVIFFCFFPQSSSSRASASSVAPTRCGRRTSCASTSSAQTSRPRTLTSRRVSSSATSRSASARRRAPASCRPRRSAPSGGSASAGRLAGTR